MVDGTATHETDDLRKGDLMKSAVTNLVTALAISALAALGGALAVFSEYDDAPGGVVVGFLLIIGAVVLSWRATGSRT
jgi:hypothetical protein